jgi:hypothetical protein
MRILIQDPESKRYYGGDHWVCHLDEAKEFESVFSAEEHCRAHDVRSALIVVKFNDATAQDIKYAVGPAHALFASKPPTTRLYRR